mgnify:CR=1 FL=1
MKKPEIIKGLVIFILLCIPFIGISAHQKVSVNVTNATLKQVFGVIEKQTSYRFSYKSGIIDNRKDVTVHKTNAPVNDVLNAAFKGRSLKYSIVSGVYSAKNEASTPPFFSLGKSM